MPKENTITAAALQEDLTAQAAQLDARPATFAPELQALLNAYTPIDFRAKAEASGLAPTENLTQKIVLVVTVREILKQTEAQGAGLAFSAGSYYIYSAGYWRELDRLTLQAFLTAAGIALGLKPNHAQHFETQDALRKQFEATALQLDPQRAPGLVLINFENGTLEIEGNRLTLRPPRRADFLKYQLPYSYDPAASCPQFKRYLNRVLPDETAQAVLSEFVGNTLAPSLNLQKVLILQGSGCNGKSVFCDIVTALLGRENVTSYTIASLTKEDSRSRFRLANALLNYSGENSIKMNAEAFKTLAAGEAIEARRLYGDSFIMEHYARLMFNCNILPKDIEQSEGFFRRFLIIPFNAKITEAEKDPQLAAKITAAELPGIFNWILEGLQRLLQARRYTDCEAARLELENYKKESNSVLCFLEDCNITPGTNEKQKESLQRLYSCYRAYCLYNGHRYPVARRQLAKTLRDNGYREAPRQAAGVYFYCNYNQASIDY